MSIKAAFVSLGCPKNQLDSEVMISKLAESGIEIVEEDIHADVVVVNTCAFIQSAKEEAIENILDVAWLKKNKNLRGISLRDLSSLFFCRLFRRQHRRFLQIRSYQLFLQRRS